MIRSVAVLLASVLTCGQAHAADAAKGQAVFSAKCASCHGKDGKGNPGMAKMVKKPGALDLTDAESAKKSDADFIAAIEKGPPPMPSYKGKLSDADIADAAAFVRSLSGGGAPAAAAPAGGGASTYAAKCASCHGKDGKGNPAMAKMFKVDLAALDLVDKDSLAKSDGELAKLTADGLNKMPAYKGKLTDGDIAAVVAYIRALAAK